MPTHAPFARLAVPLSTPPMEARLVERLPEGEGWQYEPKWDGFRCLAFRDGDAVALMSKSGKPLERYFPELVTLLQACAEQRFVLDGEIVLPVGDAPEPFVDADDIAEVVAAALTDGGHAGQTYELTGPRLLTFAEVAAELTRATGRDVRFVPVSKDDYVAALRAEGLPEEFAELFDLVTDGRNAYLADGVQQALGRPPRDFSDYAAAAAATGVWSVDERVAR